MRAKYLIAICGLFLTSPSHAAGPMAAQVCNQLSNPLLVSVHATMGMGEGCAWQWPNGQALSMYVHINGQDEAVAAMKQVMEINIQNPAFKRRTFPVCTGGDMVVGDFKNKSGPGGAGYTRCSGFVLTFGFQGVDAEKELPKVANKLAGTAFAK
ncbi:MAG: hypothetical protein CV090_13265 [Nitrospira sp. WS238]|mgnify:CR=1 FL=1|nr:hypothetical protein [Nitrospira sp. WS238]